MSVMREILTLQLGASGNAIGDAFWRLIAKEHGINHTALFTGSSSLQFDGLHTFFDYNPYSNTVHNRAIAIDTEESSIIKLKSSISHLLFNPANQIYGNQGTGQCFAKGYFSDKELIENVLDAIQDEVANLESLQGFHIIQALGGGTGSGLGALLMEKINELYPKKIIHTFSVIPSTKVSPGVVEPYNCVLSFPNLSEYSDLTYCFDNGAIFDICIRELGLSGVSKQNISYIIANSMSSVTCGLRFPGHLNSSMKKLSTNLCPFPNLQFVVTGLSPLSSTERVPCREVCVPELVLQIFRTNNLLASLDLRKGKMLSVAAIFRGEIPPEHVDTLMTDVRKKYSMYFPDWIPNNMKTSICEIPLSSSELSSVFIGNSTAITKVFSRTQKAFRGLLQRKAYLHSYLEAGMEETDFVEAENCINNIIREYKEHEKYKEPPIINAATPVKSNQYK